jgi:pilus assembly protein CpaF
MARQDIYKKTIDHYLAPIREFLEDGTVSEVMINKYNEIYIERDGGLHRTNARFGDIEGYEAAVNNILQFTHKSLYDETSLIDARLPDGSRVHVAKWPCARFGMCMTIRKFSKSMLDVDWLVEIGTMTEQVRQYIKLMVNAEANVLVAGGTSSGKTSLLNALSQYIPNDQRIVVIEDSAELDLQQDHVVSMESKAADRYGRGGVGITELFRSSLRLRPDRIVIGEVRGKEALDMIQAMTSGHGGSMGTLHANNPQDALNRLETMALMSDVDLPLHALRAQVASAINVVVQMTRHLGGRRILTQVAEVDQLDDHNRYNLRDMFTFSSEVDENGARQMQLVWSGERSYLAGHLRPNEEDMLTDETKSIFEPGEPVA